MNVIKCPICRTRFSSYLEGLARPAYSGVYCTSCGKRLELLNAGICHFISGIIFAVALVLLFFSEMSYLWLWVLLVAALCWLLNPIIVWLFGKWWLWSYRAADAAKVQLLAATQAISTIIAGIWVCYMIKVLLWPYYELLGSSDFFSERAAEFVERQRQLLSPRNIIGLVVGIISLGTSTTTSLWRRELRRRGVESKLNLPDTSDK
jgi:hypothetical protein